MILSLLRPRKKYYWEEGGFRDNITEITREGGLLDRYYAQLEPSYIYDHEKYGPYESEITEYSGEIEQLRAWINLRAANVDKAIEDLVAQKHSVKFVVDGKVIEEREIYHTFEIEELPKAPEKKGYAFIGWYSEEDDCIYDFEQGVMADTTLVAKYVNESEAVKPEVLYFNPNYDNLPFDFTLGNHEYELEYMVLPQDAVRSTIKWSVSDESTAEVDNHGVLTLKKAGDVTVTATLSNGFKGSHTYHVRDIADFAFEKLESFEFTAKSMTMAPGETGQVEFKVTPDNSVAFLSWYSSDEDVATVDDEYGLVTANKPGMAVIMATDSESEIIQTCIVIVKEKTKPAKPAASTSLKGKTVKSGGSTYVITSDKSGNRTAALKKAKNAKTVTVPATIKAGGKKFNVTKLNAGAFKGKKIRTIVIKTKKLKKATVKKSLKGSKAKTIKVKVGKKKANKQYLKKYKKIFTKKNAGKKVKLK